MEDHYSEVDDDEFFNLSEDLVRPAQIKAAGIAEVHFNGLLVNPLKLHEDLKNGCGGQLWPAGMVLSKYMLQRCKDLVKGKTVFAGFSRD
jgi:hypothetical protein